MPSYSCSYFRLCPRKKKKKKKKERAHVFSSVSENHVDDTELRGEGGLDWAAIALCGCNALIYSQCPCFHLEMFLSGGSCQTSDSAPAIWQRLTEKHLIWYRANKSRPGSWIHFILLGCPLATRCKSQEKLKAPDKLGNWLPNESAMLIFSAACPSSACRLRSV